jgi:hypothetical protein
MQEILYADLAQHVGTSMWFTPTKDLIVGHGPMRLGLIPNQESGQEPNTKLALFNTNGSAPIPVEQLYKNQFWQLYQEPVAKKQERA